MTIDTKTSTLPRKHDHLLGVGVLFSTVPLRLYRPIYIYLFHSSSRNMDRLDWVHICSGASFLSRLFAPSVPSLFPPFAPHNQTLYIFSLTCIELSSRCFRCTHSFRPSLFYTTIPQFIQGRFSLALLCIMPHIDLPPPPSYSSSSCRLTHSLSLALRS